MVLHTPPPFSCDKMFPRQPSSLLRRCCHPQSWLTIALGCHELHRCREQSCAREGGSLRGCNKNSGQHYVFQLRCCHDRRQCPLAFIVRAVPSPLVTIAAPRALSCLWPPRTHDSGAVTHAAMLVGCKRERRRLGHPPLWTPVSLGPFHSHSPVAAPIWGRLTQAARAPTSHTPLPFSCNNAILSHHSHRERAPTLPTSFPTRFTTAY